MRLPIHSQPEQDETELIYIPLEARGQPIAAFPISIRLANIFVTKRFRLFGDLHRVAFSEFQGFRNCGRKSLREIQNLVRTVQRGERSAKTARAETISPRLVQTDCLFVPVNARNLNLSDLPMSVRLEGVLRNKGVVRLGDLHGVRVNELKQLDNCGKRTIDELFRLFERTASGEFQPASEPFSPVHSMELIRSLEGNLVKLSPRDHEALLLRLGAENNRVWTLEEIGAKLGLTRERVRQIFGKTIPAMRRARGPKLIGQLKGLASVCLEMVCPLTPMLLSQWLAQNPSTQAFPLAFYVRLIGELNPDVPAWPNGQEPAFVRSRPSAAILNILERTLLDGTPILPLKRAFELTAGYKRLRDLGPARFLSTLKNARTLIIQFPKPDHPEVRLRRLPVSYVAKTILETSDCPLMPQDIIQRAQERFGREQVDWVPQTIGNALTAERGFYLLGPRSYGLRRHFKLPESMWRTAQKDCHELLNHESRPISTTEVVRERRFPWTNQTNVYELAEIIREDRRFVDLGKFLFGLAKWGIQEREYIKDLVPKILAEVGHPMTAMQVLQRLRRLRSVSPTSLPAIIRSSRGVQDYGFGYYGLVSWGKTIKDAIVTNSALVERVIRRSEPPLTFSHLCNILEIPEDDILTHRLWQTCVSLRSVLRIPDERSANTLVVHKSFTLERALVAVARAVNRPLPVYELQWELNDRFGSLFAQKPTAEIRRRLEQTTLFLRNTAAEYILDVNLDQLEVDAGLIRGACLEILTQSNEIVGCDDLIERLEAEGKVWEDVSPDILGSLLREDDAFQEIGHNRFRAKPCKR